MFRAGTWEQVWRAEIGHNGPGQWVSFSPDGRILASSGIDFKIFLYDVATGDPIGRALGPDTQAITFLYAAFRPDRNQIVGYFGDGACTPGTSTPPHGRAAPARSPAAT